MTNASCFLCARDIVLTEYNMDLHTYLNYCKDVVFAGLEPSFEDYEEEKVIKELWEIYQKDKVWCLKHHYFLIHSCISSIYICLTS